MANTVHGSGAAAAVVGIPEDVFRRRWAILAVLCTSLMIIIIGNTALNVAIPTLSRDLDATTSQLQWMVDAYSLVFAGLLLTGGAIGDRYGRKGALQLGLLVFLGGSLFAAFTNSAMAVIAGRTVMGIGAAFVMPATLSIITNVFPPHERTKAIAVWAGIAGAGAAIGPIASGFLLQHFWWGSVFLVNVPVIVIALVAGRVLLPTSRDPEQGKLDPIGAGLSIVGLGTLVYAIIEAPAHGWASAESGLAFGFAAVLLALFFWWELRTPEPMLNLRYFLDRRFSVASGGMTLVFFSMFGVFFLLTQYFQLVLGYGALEAGLKQGPIAVVMIILAPQTPRFSGRIGSNRVVAAGLVLVAAGMVLLAQMSIDTPYSVLLIPMLVLASGMALTMSPLTASIMSAVPLGKAGVGSAMNDTTRELGGALGVAVLGSLVASKYTSSISSAIGGLSTEQHHLADSSLSGALQVAASLPGDAGAALNHAARQAYLDGMSLAVVVGAIVCLVAAVVVYRLLPAEQFVRPMVPADDAEPAGSGLDGAPVAIAFDGEA
jgi:EmrB/QacA subfamily drug resistance transporter